jgi:hypothetical protein
MAVPSGAAAVTTMRGTPMIDLTTEKVVSLAEAGRILPRHRRGRPVCVSTLWRWATKGHSGVKLETARLPCGLVTSVEALQRFMQRLSEHERKGR